MRPVLFGGRGVFVSLALEDNDLVTARTREPHSPVEYLADYPHILICSDHVGMGAIEMNVLRRNRD